MANLLLTGGAGFIGSHLTKALLDAGAGVIVVDEFNDFYDPAIKEANVAPFLNNSHFRLYRKDIREFIGLRDIFEHHGRAL
ncbi:MAG: NAD-dependent epimerase/dehydratase family protein, partial [Synechococcaceae bacterium WBB_34_004]|nr:NAD-dependent epimerase/dehydratase family protein [Synechococcaceae bacterium WBB_34_004]